MINKIIDFFNRHKGQIFFVAGVLILIYVFIFDSRVLQEEVSQFAPVEVTTEEPTVNRKRTFSLVSISPQDGLSVSTFDPFNPITVEFSEPVDATSLAVRVFPPVELRPRALEDDPTQIMLLPRGSGWEPFIRYRVVIRGALGVDPDASLDRPFEYWYQNTPPELDFRDLPY